MTKEDILRRLQAGELTVSEASDLIEALPKKPRDLARLRAVGKLKAQLESLEQIEIETKVFNLKDVAQWLVGGDWEFETSPFLLSRITLNSDKRGSFRNETDEGGETAFVASPGDDGLKLFVGKPTTMNNWGVFGPSSRDVYVTSTLRLVPRPAER